MGYYVSSTEVFKENNNKYSDFVHGVNSKLIPSNIKLFYRNNVGVALVNNNIAAAKNIGDGNKQQE